jgi:hypothetical protein
VKHSFFIPRRKGQYDRAFAVQMRFTNFTTTELWDSLYFPNRQI